MSLTSKQSIQLFTPHKAVTLGNTSDRNYNDHKTTLKLGGSYGGAEVELLDEQKIFLIIDLINSMNPELIESPDYKQAILSAKGYILNLESFINNDSLITERYMSAFSKEIIKAANIMNISLESYEISNMAFRIFESFQKNKVAYFSFNANIELASESEADVKQFETLVGNLISKRLTSVI